MNRSSETLFMVAVAVAMATGFSLPASRDACAAPPQTDPGDLGEYEFEFTFTDPDPSSVTLEDARSILDRITPFVQVRPRWEPPDESEELKRYQYEWQKRDQEVAQRRIDLAGRLIELDIDHPRMSMLARDFFELPATTLQDPERTISRTTDYIQSHPDGKYLAEAWAVRTRLQVHRFTTPSGSQDFYAALSATMDLIETGLDPQMAAYCLMMIASQVEHSDPELYRHVLTRVVEFFPDSEFAVIATGKLDRLHALGQPFELEFEDAVTGRRVSIEDYRGKVVIIDFWATWCGPCVAKMPKLRELHEKYQSRGVEVIGVSLDSHVESVIHFVTEHGYSWPQFFEERKGDRIGSAFTQRWGVQGIPAVFIIDQQGLLHTIDARGREEAIVLELLGES